MGSPEEFRHQYAPARESQAEAIGVSPLSIGKPTEAGQKSLEFLRAIDAQSVEPRHPTTEEWWAIGLKILDLVRRNVKAPQVESSGSEARGPNDLIAGKANLFAQPLTNYRIH
jgi:hypothetical protein